MLHAIRSDVPYLSSTRKPRFLDQVRELLRAYYSIRTEEAYLGWIRRFILFHGKRHPKEIGLTEVVPCLSLLAAKEQVSASTQNQACSAPLLLYRDVLRQPTDNLGQMIRAPR